MARSAPSVSRFRIASREPLLPARNGGSGQTNVSLALDAWQWLVLNLALLDADFRINEGTRFADACRTFGRQLLAATA